MKQTTRPLKTLRHRAILALMLLTFFVASAVVGPGRMPADEVRAGYLAAGLLCAPDGQNSSHRDAHCVLCLLPATGTSPEAANCNSSRAAKSFVVKATEDDLIPIEQAVVHHARAPPSSAV